MEKDLHWKTDDTNWSQGQNVPNWKQGKGKPEQKVNNSLLPTAIIGQERAWELYEGKKKITNSIPREHLQEQPAKAFQFNGKGLHGGKQQKEWEH